MPLPATLFAVACLIVTYCHVGAAAGALLAAGVRVEGHRHADSTGIYVDSASPRVSWAVKAAPGTGVPWPIRQVGYRIVASRSVGAFGRSDYDAWDSGTVISGNSMHIRYGGRGLECVGGTIFIGVFVFDAEMHASTSPAGPYVVSRAPGIGEPWASAAWLGQTAAQWSSDCAQYQDDPEPLFRLPISTGVFAGGVSEAHLFVTGTVVMGIESVVVKRSASVTLCGSAGIGWFQAFINGDRIGDAFLEPAWTTYSRRTLFSAYNVTAAIAAAGSEAVLGITLGKGWRDPLPMRLFGAFDIRDALPVGRTAFIAWLLVIDGAGHTHNFTSSLSSAWRVGTGAVLRNNVYLGEVVDLRVLHSPEVKGWALPGFNDSNWARPVLANTSAIGPLQVRDCSPAAYLWRSRAILALSAASTRPSHPRHYNVCSHGSATHTWRRGQLHAHFSRQHGWRCRGRRCCQIGRAHV